MYGAHLIALIRGQIFLLFLIKMWFPRILEIAANVVPMFRVCNALSNRDGFSLAAPASQKFVHFRMIFILELAFIATFKADSRVRDYILYMHVKSGIHVRISDVWGK